MAKRDLKEKALKLRESGKSYSQIREEIKVSKSTLSVWLKDYPLSKGQLKKLRDKNPKRIEKFRNTMQMKRETVINVAYKRVSKDIGKLTKRELFISGFFMYWGEGLKSGNTATSLTNTDPAIINFFIEWITLLGAEKNKLKVKLHLYSEMDIAQEKIWWSKRLKISEKNFHKPYVKKTELSHITYKKKAEHGTCTIIFYNRDLNDYVLMGIRRLKELYKLE